MPQFSRASCTGSTTTRKTNKLDKRCKWAAMQWPWNIAKLRIPEARLSRAVAVATSRNQNQKAPKCRREVHGNKYGLIQDVHKTQALQTNKCSCSKPTTQPSQDVKQQICFRWAKLLAPQRRLAAWGYTYVATYARGLISLRQFPKWSFLYMVTVTPTFISLLFLNRV